MSFENLPGVITNKIDGNLTLEEINRQPVQLILGYSNKGPSEDYTRVTSISSASKTFGLEGNLVRGLFENYGWGGKNFRAWRYGGTAANIAGIGVDATTGGIVVETILKDDEAGDDFTVYWDNTGKELHVWDDSGFKVFHRDFDGASVPDLDAGIVAVSGVYIAGEGADIGTGAAVVSGVNFQTPGGATTYTPGTDGTEDGGPSYMEKYEGLYKAYKLLENEAIDYVVPMDVYLDVPNIADDATVFSAYSWTPATNRAFPRGGAPEDALAKVYTQEFQGEYYFWWDIDGDGIAEIFPNVGSSTGTTNADGTALLVSDYREVNFAYQLAYFCYNQSVNTHECLGTIGVLPPISTAQKDVITWIGESPTYSEDDNNQLFVMVPADNGSGLLGNKFMAGRTGYRTGTAYGGFILTADGYPTQTASVEQTDANDHVIDIGKYISIVSGYNILNTPWDTSGNGYISNMAPAYAGFDSSLPTGSAATNKQISKARLPWRVNLTKLNALTRFRYVMTGRRTKGVVWVDAPTAARPDSDYQRQSTVRTVKRVLNDVRIVCDPFVGEANSATQRAAMKTQIDAVLSRYRGLGLNAGQSTVNATVEQEIRGEATVELILVPAFELRQITITLSLAAGL